MRKLSRIDAPPRLVASMFSNLNRWTAWMPGVESVTELESGDSELLMLIRQRWMGRSLALKCRFELSELGLRQVQVAGFFRRWDLRWSFRPAPYGEGTTVGMDLDLELPFPTRLAPRRLVQETLDRMFEEVMDKARDRARAILAEETISGPLTGIGDQPLVEAYETDLGLEIRIGGRRYRLERVRES